MYRGSNLYYLNHSFNSNAGGIIAVGRAILVRQVLNKVPEKEKNPGLPVWGLFVVLSSSRCKNLVALKPWQQEGHGLKMGWSTIKNDLNYLPSDTYDYFLV